MSAVANGDDALQSADDVLAANADEDPATVRMRMVAYDYQRIREKNPDALPDGWARSFPDNLQASAGVFQELHEESPRAAESVAMSLTGMPEVGTDYLGFHLIEELGRGAFGRVYLARQEALANRLVALKVAPNINDEMHTLAQLQHTHIVPIHSVHDAGLMKAVCMPFLGSHTLSSIMSYLRKSPASPKSGTDLFRILHDSSTKSSGNEQTSSSPKDQQAAAHPRQEVPSAILKRLESLSYTEAVLWLGSCLADGLAHAHERGIFHRDIKPANILITDEGQPLLLDFNLAKDTKIGGSVTAALVGGTLPYMSPEQIEAFTGAKREVDGRSDIFSLGIVFFELLTGKLPYPTSQDTSVVRETVQKMLVERCQAPPSVRAMNPVASPAMAAIVRKCLESDPAKRYQSARHLHEDLTRQLEYLPLKHAPNPSLRERVQKHLRRSPRLWTIAAAGAAVLLLGIAVVFGARARQAQLTAQALDVKGLFHADLNKIRFALNTQKDLVSQRKNLALCRENLQRYQVLDNPDWRELPEFTCLAQSDRDQLEKNIGVLLHLAVRARLLLAAAKDKTMPAAALHELQRWNEEAGRCLGGEQSSKIVLLQRADLLDRAGKNERASAVRGQANALPLRSVQDLSIFAQDLTTERKFRAALPLLQRAVDKAPSDYWVNFLLGICFDGVHDDPEAVNAYTVCIALEPDFHGSYFNRGLAFLRQKMYDKARNDFTQGIAREPDLADYYINRALAWQGMQEYAKAISDYGRALELNASSRVYFMRARAKRRAGDEDGYKKDRAAGIRSTPTTELDWLARAWARTKDDPKGALADYDRALGLNPFSRTAWNNKAFVYAYYLKKPRQSLKMLDKVIRFYPDHAPAWSGRGVLHARLGDRKAAHRDALAALDRDRRAPILYQVGCVYALTSKTHKEDRAPALRHVADALRQGFGADLLARDDDLDALRGLPEFGRLLQVASTLRKRGK